MNITLETKRTVSNAVLPSNDILVARVSRAKRIAPNAPTAAASVGVKNPPYMPPMVTKNSKTTCQILPKAGKIAGGVCSDAGAAVRLMNTATSE